MVYASKQLKQILYFCSVINNLKKVYKNNRNKYLYDGIECVVSILCGFKGNRDYLCRNGMDLTEAEDIKKRWQEYTEELYKKDLHDPDNHYGVITDLQPDILECEVKWALESITMNKASRGDGIPVELFQILKDDAVKVLHSICQQIWETQQWPQDWKKSVNKKLKRSVFIPIPKKGNAKECSNYRTIAFISHVGSSKKQESSRKTSTSALLTMPKPLIV